MNPIIIINFGSRYLHHIENRMAELGFAYATVHWEEESLKQMKGSGYILSGSPCMLTEVDHQPYFDRCGFLKEVNVPVLGICFGHQVLGILHGANIFKGDEIKGDNSIEIVKQDILFNGFENEMLMEENHTEGITLPERFVHLGASTSYLNEAMKHPQKKMYGVQFHPEVSGENGKVLIENFLKHCK